MTAHYLLDTNTVSYSIKGEPRVVRARMNAVPSSLVAISAFTQAELLFGLAKKPQAKRLCREVEAFLGAFQIFPWDSAAARAYGEMRAAQERKGLPLSHEDLMIAAHALALDLTLVTHDAAFAQVDGLRREDWAVSPED
jgi:tRNA(fMet)-specific endonuclease VapC